jgi:hypothetical protein
MPIESYLASMILPIVSKPDVVRITPTTDEMGVLLSIDVDKDDMGVVIGKAGETAKAIRHMVRIAGVRQNARVSVKINEPDGGPPRYRRSDASDRDLII